MGTALERLSQRELLQLLPAVRNLRAEWTKALQVTGRGSGGFIQESEVLKLWPLKVWAMRYRVSLTLVVRTLCGEWDSFCGRSVRGYRIGKSLPPIAMLASPKSEKRLADALLLLFPHQENLTEWRLRAQEKQLHREVPLKLTQTKFVGGPGGNMLAGYEASIERKRAMQKEAREKLIGSRRPYRNNPWR